jgi:GTP-binding protein Era
MTDGFRTGYLAVIGRPNVGKSTLTNRLVGAKISITSKKAQTTRHRIHGILTTDDAQFIFVDTPGFQMTHKNALNRLMNRSVTSSFADVDVILSGGRSRQLGQRRSRDPAHAARSHAGAAGDQQDRPPRRQGRAAALHRQSCRRCTALPRSCRFRRKRILASASCLLAARPYLPEGPAIFDADDITDRNERFLASEILREKLFRNLGEELPYGIAVEIEKFEQEGELRRIHAAVIVDKSGHKPIVIGRGGERLKRISTDARKEMETLFGGKVWLETWVKVKGGWADDERALKSLGYD